MTRHGPAPLASVSRKGRQTAPRGAVSMKSAPGRASMETLGGGAPKVSI